MEVNNIYRALCEQPGPPRSVPYKAGFMAGLQGHLGNGLAIVCPWSEGTAECDAFWSGSSNGKIAARDCQEHGQS